MASCVLLIVNSRDVLRNAYASMRDAGYLVIPLNDAGQAVERSSGCRSMWWWPICKRSTGERRAG